MENAVTFSDITGASLTVAEGYLRMAEGQLEPAIQLFFENPELQHNFGAASAGNSRAQSRPSVGREDADGVIHLDDSDEDEDFGIDDDEDGARAEATRIAAAAQAEEDAAMAKRLQEELYAESGNRGGDDVRAPIASRTETLVGGGWDSYDQDTASMDFVAEMDRRRRARQAASSNPFSQSIWDAPMDSRSSSRDPETGQATSRTQRLAQLFQPPFDIMAHLSWEDARDEGKEEKKWILVNLQDMNIFQCQTLNRDIWRDTTVKELVKEHFIFLQYAKDDINSEQYLTFYFPGQQHENPDIYPHVSIIDPRTGEQVKVWSGSPFPSAAEFHSQLVEFLDRYSLSDNSKNPVAKTASKSVAIDFDRMTEEEMLEMALKNSMGGRNEESSVSGALDPDALTKIASSNPEPVEQTAFEKIASDRPHTEPDNNPATTTRIQFRHASGRVIRRFKLDDRVERIYEWLKCEPLNGNDVGTEFELKRMPQSVDLLEMLDKTIAEAGLKQGTVMVEYM
ncbi:hypothetical protein TD95_005333 [Thielaviopsis punctulata]|uniref:UBX domain-containing protein n=1 Tax=Thielaviopsis punctulata TaxID=72032 RepID=A0A0F4ZJM1_9PEZI|nr:hypothetical protein TD95_005333 [Thielaviopsis punctulata]